MVLEQKVQILELARQKEKILEPKTLHKQPSQDPKDLSWILGIANDLKMNRTMPKQIPRTKTLKTTKRKSFKKSNKKLIIKFLSTKP